MKKVLFLTNVPSPYRVCFFNELGKECNLTVLFELNNSSERNTLWQEFKAENYEAIFLKGKRTDVDKAKCREVKKYLVKKWDVIIIGGYSSPTQQIAIRYLKRKRISFILNSDGGIIPKKEFFLKKWYKRWIIKKASMYITTGEASVRQLAYYGANLQNIFVYPFTSVYENDIIDLDLVDKIELKRKLGIVEDLTVVSVGSFIHRKGMDVVIKAAEQLKDKNIGFYIIGGEPNEELLSLKGNNEKIHFVSHIFKAELMDYYKASDIFTLMTRYEIWGLVINEALASGLPIITTDMCNAGLEMIRNNENGYVIPVDNISILVQQIEETIFDTEKLSKLQQNAIGVAKHYTYEKMVSRHLEIFEEFVFNKKQPNKK
ncbi:MAG: glycosyltransferase family 4 protein [Defluviitaleaceae bacterium]|nr:glycosyltransferase family 4 protein [Defluviitaleaceae bacterium]